MPPTHSFFHFIPRFPKTNGSFLSHTTENRKGNRSIAVFILLASALILFAGLFAAADEKASEPAEANPIALTVWQLPNQTPTQMMSYVFKADSGEVFVIDGGNTGDADYLVERIKAARPDGHVSAWFLTHLHSDHVNALCKIMTDKTPGISVDCIYFNFPPMEWFEKNSSKGEQKEARDFYDALPLFPKTETCQPGQTWTFGSATVECLNDFDPEQTVNPVNNTSVVFRVTTPKTSLLFLGDLGVEGGKRIAQNVPREKLKIDYLQMAHHGQNGVNREFYALCAPTYCLWPTPDWLWNNNPGTGDDTGPWKTVQVRGWMNELGVKKHAVIKDGLAEFRLE